MVCGRYLREWSATPLVRASHGCPVTVRFLIWECPPVASNTGCPNDLLRLLAALSDVGGHERVALSDWSKKSKAQAKTPANYTEELAGRPDGQQAKIDSFSRPGGRRASPVTEDQQHQPPAPNARQRPPRLRHLNQSAILILEPDAVGGQQTGYSSAARRDTDLGRAVENESKSQGCTSRCAQDPARRLVTQGSGGEMAYEIQLNDQGLLQCRVCLA